jgi:hypothetical protein
MQIQQFPTAVYQSNLKWGETIFDIIDQAWQGLHFKKLPALVGMALKVEFFRPDGTLRYKRPRWLLWTGPKTIALKEL